LWLGRKLQALGDMRPGQSGERERDKAMEC
jgi:hypothetical protein